MDNRSTFQDLASRLITKAKNNRVAGDLTINKFGRFDPLTESEAIELTATGPAYQEAFSQSEQRDDKYQVGDIKLIAIAKDFVNVGEIQAGSYQAAYTYLNANEDSITNKCNIIRVWKDAAEAGLYLHLRSVG